MEIGIFLVLSSYLYCAAASCSFKDSLTPDRPLMYRENPDVNIELLLSGSTIRNLHIPKITSSTWLCVDMLAEGSYIFRNEDTNIAENLCISWKDINQNMSCLHTLIVGNLTSCNYCSPFAEIYSITLYKNLTTDTTSQCEPYKCSKYRKTPAKEEEKEAQVFVVGIVIAIFCIGGFLIGLCLYIVQQKKKDNPKQTEEEEMTKIESEDGAGPEEDFKNIQIGEIQIYTEEIQ